MNQLEKMNRNLFSDFIKDNSFADYIINRYTVNICQKV